MQPSGEMDLLQRHEPVLVNRDLLDRPPPIPVLRIRELTPDVSSVQKRATDSSGNQTSGGSDTTPIVIGVVIPVLIIAIILFVIWRRRQVITKQEEANDKYKSLDFGYDESALRGKKSKKNGKGMPEMSIADVQGALRKDKGLSVDLGTSNPYILPPEVHQSRESLHSLSRTMTTGDDKYRATNFIPDDGSIRAPSSMRSHGDNSSVFTASTRHRTGTMDTDSKQDLIPRIGPVRDTSQPSGLRKPLPPIDKPQTGLLAPVPQEADRHSTVSTASSNLNFAAIRASNNYLGQFISGGQKKDEPKTEKHEEQPGLMVSETEVPITPPINEPQHPPAAHIHNENPNPKRQSSFYGSPNNVAELADNHYDAHRSIQPTLPQIEPSVFEMDGTDHSQYPQRHQSQHAPEVYNQHAYDHNPQHPPVPEINVQQQDYDDDASDYYDEENYDEYADYLAYSNRTSMIGTRPLPPDDPLENPEQRANRIRSFYKEYFDDSTNAGHNRAMDYYDGSEQYDDFDYGYYEQSHSRGPSIRSDGRYRAFSHGQHGYPPRGGPRAFSSMSGRPGPRRPPPKKKLPPPKPLMVLPTPHKLKDDDFLPNAIDFAPPQVFKNQRSGTPDSLRGGLRPYSPMVRAHVPLNSSFDDLAAIPSPHSLRKSGTFTALDFAPPRRFKENGDAMSDSGSVRSNRSNLSRVHLANIRNGAYRVSRIPKEVAGTRDDMFTALKPTWDMRGDVSDMRAESRAQSRAH